jgi:hypothetical protein
MFFEREGNLAQGGPGAGGLDGEREQVALPVSADLVSASRQRRTFAPSRVALSCCSA